MRFKGQGHSLTLVKGHSDFKVKCLSFGLYTQVSDSGPLGPLVFKCLTATIPLTCTLANEYRSRNEISKKNSTVRGDCIACDALF